MLNDKTTVLLATAGKHQTFAYIHVQADSFSIKKRADNLSIEYSANMYETSSQNTCNNKYPSFDDCLKEAK